MGEQMSVRTLFLQQFIAAVIARVHPREELKVLKINYSHVRPMIAKEDFISNEFRPSGESFQKVALPLEPKVIPFNMRSPALQISRPLPPRPQRMQQSFLDNPKTPLERIQRILADSSIRLLECPGPNKPLLVTQYGGVRSLPLMLTKEEIDGLVKSLSERTRIPLSTGIFTAAFDQYIINAILSEFLGTRFVIQRKPTQAASFPIR